MENMIYRYHFYPSVSMDDVVDSLMLATVATEAIYGRSRIQMDSSFLLDKKNRTCTIDAGTPVGSNIAVIFTGFLSCEIGEEGFSVEQVRKGKEAPDTSLN